MGNFKTDFNINQTCSYTLNYISMISQVATVKVASRPHRRVLPPCESLPSILTAGHVPVCPLESSPSCGGLESEMISTSADRSDFTVPSAIPLMNLGTGNVA